MGAPASSVTRPVTVFCCADARTERRKIPIIAMRSLVFISGCTGMWWTLGARRPARVERTSGAGVGPRTGLAAVAAHRRAVAPRAARARDVVVAGCGTGAYVAGDGVATAHAYLQLDIKRDDPPRRRAVTITRGAREARFDNPILHPRVVRSSTASGARPAMAGSASRARTDSAKLPNKCATLFA